MARTPRTPALPATPPAASATAAAASTGGGPSSPPAPRSTAESPPSAPVKDKPISSFADYKEKWNTPATAKTTKLEFDEELRCNRPSCPFTLVQFIPPGTNPQTGVTFAVCRSGSCAGGGTILRYSAKCCACHGTIPEGTVCLSIKTDYNSAALGGVPQDSAASSAAPRAADGEGHTGLRVGSGGNELHEGEGAGRAVAAELLVELELGRLRSRRRVPLLLLSRWYSVSGCETCGKPTEAVVFPCLASITSSCLSALSVAEDSDMRHMYKASGGLEYFISSESPEETLDGFLRLRVPSETSFLPDL
eukprot:jgi/Undpi1/13608/HiC_scaffold_9.g03262.m1